MIGACFHPCCITTPFNINLVSNYNLGKQTALILKGKSFLILVRFQLLSHLDCEQEQSFNTEPFCRNTCECKKVAFEKWAPISREH